MKTRIITGLLLIAVILPIVIIGKLPFLIFVYAILALALKEINHLFNRSHWPSYLKLCVYIVPLILFTSWPIYQTLSFERILLMILIFLTISLFDERFSFNDMVTLIFILTLVLTGFKMMLFVRHLPRGLDLMIYVALITFGTDTFAYFSGYLFGKHKLNPRISPKKTIEGAIGGTLIGSSLGIAFLIFRFEAFMPIDIFSIIRIICFTLVLSISGQIGDLTFSAIKRHFSIKDFSQLLPGHGGILDRFDAFLFNFITFYIAMIVLSSNVAVIF